MGEALHGGHKMLNHLGMVIRVTRRTIRALDMRNYLRRDHRSGLLQLRPEFYQVFKELERTNRDGRMFNELGADCSGPNVAMCRCRQCSGKVAELDHTRLSDEYRRVKTNEVIRAVKAKRRRH
jgi:hypothetical protein